MKPINFEMFAMWIAMLKTNPPKTKGFLETRKTNGELIGRCCLGEACHIFCPELAAKGHVFSDEKTFTRFDGVSGTLPPNLSEQLGISPSGNLTKTGVRIAALFLREHHIARLTSGSELPSLADVNDCSEIDLATVGDLIEMLVEQERQGVVCFVRLIL